MTFYGTQNWLLRIVYFVFKVVTILVIRVKKEQLALMAIVKTERHHFYDVDEALHMSSR